MGRSQREKGKRGERKAAKILQPVFPHVKRSAAQFRGGHEAADLASTGMLHVEVKHGKKPNVRDALRQALRDKPPGKIAVAMILDDNESPFVVLDANEFVTMLVSINEALSGQLSYKNSVV